MVSKAGPAACRASSSISRTRPRFLPIDADQWLYYFTLAVVLVMFAAAANLVKSRTGRAIMAIRDHPIAAAAMGINAPLYKTLTFGVSALYTGVAGALGALAVQFVAPDSFSLFLSISFPGRSDHSAAWARCRAACSADCSCCTCRTSPKPCREAWPGAIYGVIMLLVIFRDAVGRRRLRAVGMRASVAIAQSVTGKNDRTIAR